MEKISIDEHKDKIASSETIYCKK